VLENSSYRSKVTNGLHTNI